MLTSNADSPLRIVQSVNDNQDQKRRHSNRTDLLELAIDRVWRLGESDELRAVGEFGKRLLWIQENCICKAPSTCSCTAFIPTSSQSPHAVSYGRQFINSGRVVPRYPTRTTRGKANAGEPCKMKKRNIPALERRSRNLPCDINRFHRSSVRFIRPRSWPLSSRRVVASLTWLLTATLN